MATERVVRPKVRAQRTELTNVVCPKCDGPIYFTEARWLFCANCHATKLGTGAIVPTAGAPIEPTHGVTRDNLDAVKRWIAAARKLSEACKRDSEVCRLLRTAPPEFRADLERERVQTLARCARAAALARRLHVAAFGPNPDEGA